MDEHFKRLEELLMSDNEAVLSAIDSLKGEMRSQHANLNALSSTNSAKLDKLEIILTGGSEPSKGVVVRLDRVEQQEEGRRWWQRGLSAGVLGAIGLTIWNWLTGGGNATGHGP